MDSADAWANPELFQLDENNVPLAITGCPPDGFSAIGQLWGNPLYRWDYHRSTGYAWWMSRLWYCFNMYDVVRIDHFRGFDEYFSIPYGAETAKGGHWEQGPGMSLFNRMKEVLGDRAVIAEDLGYMTDTVKQLVADSGFPGMKVLEFAFDSRDTGNASDYLPHNYDKNCVAYTGTHDNETLTGWFKNISDEERTMTRDYLNDYHSSDEEIYWNIINLVMRSHADLCIIPMQDYLGYDNSARMNQPSTVGINWRWRITEEEMPEKLQKDIRTLTRRFGRLSHQWQKELDETK
jgi:4-alpha-glucanotransferase